MRELISEEEADVLLVDLKNKLATKSTEARLMALRKNLSDVEQDSEEAFKKRRELVKLLVEKITVDRDEDGRIEVHITYRFGAPPKESDRFVYGVQDSLGFLRT